MMNHRVNRRIFSSALLAAPWAATFTQPIAAYFESVVRYQAVYDFVINSCHGIT